MFVLPNRAPDLKDGVRNHRRPMQIKGGRKVKRFETLNERFPDHDLAIRRLHRDDPAFREICDDYEEATRASDYWRSPPDQSQERAQQYQDLATELESEIRRTLASETR